MRLQDVTPAAAVEKLQRQSRQFVDVVAHQAHVHPPAHVEEDVAAQRAQPGGGQQEHALGDDDQHDEVDVVHHDAVVHHVLQQEGEEKLEDAAQHEARHQLPQQGLVTFKVVQYVTGALLVQSLLVLIEEGRRGFQHEYVSYGLTVGVPLRGPPLDHFLPAHVRFADHRIGIGNVVAPLADAVKHHEVLLVPGQDAGQGDIFFQLLQRHRQGQRLHPDRLGPLADAQHTHPLPADAHPFAQKLGGVVTAIVLGHHAQASRATVHLFELLVVSETDHC